jgi:hypothetical protein
MNETLDNLFAKYQQLSDEDFNILLGAMMKEKEARNTRAERAAWQRVCDAIECYINEYGYITITDDDVETELWRGGYTTATIGKIEVGA